MTKLVIEHLNASDLPPQWAQRLKVVPGQTVTVRIETETTATPGEKTMEFVTDDPAFSIWGDYEEAEDVAAFARRLRTPRYNRDGSRNEG